MSRIRLEQLWWPRAQVQDPLEALRVAIVALDDGHPVPAPAARLIAAAFRQYLAGTCTDITRGLGLRPRRGGRYDTPLAIERRRRKIELLVQIFAAQDGSKSGRAAQVVRLLGQDAAGGAVEHDHAAAIAALRAEFGMELPKTARAVLRAVEGAADA